MKQRKKSCAVPYC